MNNPTLEPNKGNKNVDTTQKLPTVLSLCSGYGGLERGLSLAGFMHRVVAHVEIETYAIANLVTKMEAGQMDAAPVWSNLKTLPVEPFRDRVDLLTGGYPCQPFSAAGKRLGKEDPRHLWPYICDIIRAVRPVSCFFENVEGHISLGLREVISDLESIGYKVAWGIFSAREIGAPHQRKRVYILADSSRKGLQGELQARESNTQRRKEQDGCSAAMRGVRSNDLAYPNSTGGRQDWKQGKLRTEGIEQSPGNPWPTRPGQTQQGWEEPRVLGNPQQFCLQRPRKHGGLDQEGEIPEGTKGGQLTPSDSESGLARKREDTRTDPPYSVEAKPGLGRATDGFASRMDASENRVDRLRLLGNGVVPQTAAKAWTTLQKQIRKF